LKKKQKSPLKIGLTGGIGSGKTTVAKILKSCGIPVFNSDIVSKKLIRKNENVVRSIIKEFGESIFKNNQIDTKLLAKIVFSNKNKLSVLNNIIHPYVIQKFDEWVKKQNSKYIIKESAILFESNTYQKLDKIIAIKSPIELRIKRVCKRDNRSKIDVKNIIKNQMKESEYIQYVDFVINNNEALLLPKIIQLKSELSHL
tara:strand:+ start:2225 stop:2824 length:600 start_codon:yes stop_codon:yes gene_type:complete